MSHEDEFHAPGYYSTVKRRTALDMLSDQELIDELVERRRMMVVTAKRVFPLNKHDREGLLAAMTNKLVSDIGGYLNSHQLIATDEEAIADDMHYRATVVVLNQLPEERPI